MNCRFTLSYLIVFVSLLCVVGCGDGRPTRVPVSGQVTIDGKPLTEGTIQFYPVAGGRQSGTSIGEDGRFVLTTFEQGDGIPVGDYSVAIMANKIISNTQVKWLVPKRYADKKTANISATIDSETDQMNIKLTWEDSGSSHKEPYIEKM